MSTTTPSKGVGGHHRAYRGRTDEWLTPQSIIEALGPFDLDPCAPIMRPWDMAARYFTMLEDGLSQPWTGKVWLNPPYGPQTGRWLAKLAKHGNGFALVFARTETRMFFDWVWPYASAILFVRGRLHFCNANGDRSKPNAGGPSVVIAYGEKCAADLAHSRIPDGQYVKLDAPNAISDREEIA